MKTRNRQKKAVALKYEPRKDNAPQVTAKGKGEIAEKIIQIAREHNIFVKNDPDLIEILACLDIHQEIPPHLYVVVAELLAFVYSLNRGEKFQ